MKRLLLFFFFSIFFCNQIYSLDTKYSQVVTDFINCIKNNDKTKLSTMINFPLKRQYPIKDINNPQEFLQRFDEIFDKNLIKIIVKSSINKDWDDVGWRGIMLIDGLVWLDYDGKLTAVNYQSKLEKAKREEIINNDKKNLYENLKKFKDPILNWKTKNFRIRIDDLGNDKYRYAVWPASKLQSEKPDLILYNGTINFDGSGGNHYYEFINGTYKYQIYVAVMKEDQMPPGVLTVFNNNKEILSEPVISINGE